MINIIAPTWQWVMENRFEISRLVRAWYEWRWSKVIIVIPKMQRKRLLEEIKRRFRNE